MKKLKNEEDTGKLSSLIIQKLKNQRGTVFSIMTAFCFATNSFFVKLVYRHSTVNEHDLMYIRSFYGIIYFFILSLISSNSVLQIKREALSNLFFRMLFGFFGFMFVFYMYKILPLSIATVIFFTYPGFMSLCCFLFFKERLSFYDYLGMFASFIGLCILIFNESSSTEQNEYSTWALIIPLIAAIICAL